MTEKGPILLYEPAPTRRSGHEQLRTFIRDGVASVVVFPMGLWNNGRFRLGMTVIAAALLLLLPPVYFGDVHFLFLLLPIITLGGEIWYEYEPSFQQAEFEIRPECLFMVTFGPRGVQQRRWPWTEIQQVFARRMRYGDAALCLIDRHGKRTEVFRGRADALDGAAQFISRQAPAAHSA